MMDRENLRFSILELVFRTYGQASTETVIEMVKKLEEQLFPETT